MILLAGAVLSASPALAADALKFGPEPEWVRPQQIPLVKSNSAPVAMLLQDEQIAFEPGKTIKFSEEAFRIQTPQGLDAGNLSFAWQPQTDTVTVNKLQIRRGDKIIDVLAAGQTFTVLRRETNLEAAVLDGTLTANIQPEGLQVGDTIDLAMTVEHADPVLRGHVEAAFAAWNGMPLQSGHVLLSWPANLKVKLHESDGLPRPTESKHSAMVLAEISGSGIEPLVPPKDAPMRFTIGRLAEATDFASWDDAAKLMRPLYLDAAAIPSSGPLRDELEKIRAASNDPKTRAEQALALVQDRVRYVALLMGQGGFVPARAEQTWSRRFGDCKGKTVLLLALLRELGIAAEPVLVNTQIGDVIADRLPMLELFNHVLVRAHIGGRDYWLDGTRTGDTDLDSIKVSNFGWGLPLAEHAALVHIVPSPLKIAQDETVLDVDASAGVYAPASAHADETMRGDLARAFEIGLSSYSEAQRQSFFQSYWSKEFDFITFKSGNFTFDRDKGELHLTMTGDATLDWAGGYFHVPDSSVGYHPNFDRQPGPLHDVPFAISYPDYQHWIVRLRAPSSLFAGRKLGTADVHETLAGMEYNRATTLTGNVLTVDTSARSLVPEITYSEAKAAEARLIALSDEDVALPLPPSYRMTDADLQGLHKLQPQTADELVTRGSTYLGYNHLDDAIADFSKALSLNSKDAVALADRGLAYFYKKDLTSAEKDFDAAESIEPSNAVLLRGRALMAENKGNTASAIEYYSRSLQKEPGNDFALSRRSLLYSGNEQFKLAINDLSDILTRDPRNLMVLVRRADLYLIIADYESAKKDLSAAKAIDPDNLVLLDAEARLAAANGDPNGELAAYSRMIELAKGKDKARALARRAEAYQNMNRYAEALADSDAAIKLGDTSVDVRLTRANLFKKEGDDKAVSSEAEAMIRENPESTYAFVAAGRSYGAIGEREKAMEAFTRALAIKPEAYIYTNRAEVRPRSDVNARIADLNAALKLDPTDNTALWSKAQLLSDDGNYSAALALIDKMPGDADYVRNERAALLFKAGRTDEAKQLLETAQKAAKTASQLNGLCWMMATNDIMLDSALEDCREALKLKPGTGAYLDSLGMALLKLGKLDEALDAYTHAIAKDSGAASLMGRAFVYLRKGDRARAEADAAAASKLAPSIVDTFLEYGLKWGGDVVPDEAASARPTKPQAPMAGFHPLQTSIPKRLKPKMNPLVVHHRP